MIHLLVKGKETCHGLWCNFFAQAGPQVRRVDQFVRQHLSTFVPFHHGEDERDIAPSKAWQNGYLSYQAPSSTSTSWLLTSAFTKTYVLLSRPMTLVWSGAWEKRRELSGLHPRLQALQRKVPSQAIASRGGVSTCFSSDFLPDSAVFAPRKAEKRESKVWATPWTRGCWLFTLWKCRALVQKVTMLVSAHHVHSCIPYGLDTNAHGVQSPTVWPFEHQCSWWYPWTSEAHSDQKRSGSLIE